MRTIKATYNFVGCFFNVQKGGNKMGNAKYNAIRIAKQLCYSENVINKIKAATSESEITRILHDAREAME